MISDLLHDEHCRWCGRNLRDSFLAEVAGGVEKNGSTLHPILCVCGGITVIGAGTFVSYFDEVANLKQVLRGPPRDSGTMNRKPFG